jgi:hypothetical protein
LFQLNELSFAFCFKSLAGFLGHPVYDCNFKLYSNPFILNLNKFGTYIAGTSKATLVKDSTGATTKKKGGDETRRTNKTSTQIAAAGTSSSTSLPPAAAAAGAAGSSSNAGEAKSGNASKEGKPRNVYISNPIAVHF